MPIRLVRAALALALLAMLAQTSIYAAPRTPARGDEVIEHLPRRADPAQQEFRRLRAQLAANPNDLPLASQIAQRYIVTARAESDPRYLGYAQAALAPWWNSPSPPREVRLLRATLMQSTHHFPEAMQDLDAVLAADPADAQAWLTRATVQTVRGDYAGATASCAHLSSLTTELAAITCIANVAGMNGRAAQGEALLDATLRRAGDADPGMQAWVLTLLAEMAGRRGDAAVAEQRFVRALALAPRDSYLVGAYCDLLLDQRRPREVLRLVQGQTRIDGLLLRQALALQQIPSEREALRRAGDELKARFAAAMQRGDSVHQREQARYELHLRGDSKAALALAQKNWAVQKESADMRVLLEAALQAGDKAAAAPVLDWIRKNAVEDVMLARLAKQIGAGA
jgi:Tfp pilus assembly protein PilF